MSVDPAEAAKPMHPRDRRGYVTLAWSAIPAALFAGSYIAWAGGQISGIFAAAGMLVGVGGMMVATIYALEKKTPSLRYPGPVMIAIAAATWILVGWQTWMWTHPPVVGFTQAQLNEAVDNSTAPLKKQIQSLENQQLSTSSQQPPSPPVLNRSSYGQMHPEDGMDAISQTLLANGKSATDNIRRLNGFTIGPPPTVGNELWRAALNARIDALQKANSSLNTLHSEIEEQIMSHGDVADDLKDAVRDEEKNVPLLRNVVDVALDYLKSFKRVYERGDGETVRDMWNMLTPSIISLQDKAISFDRWRSECDERINAKRSALSKAK